MFQITEFGACPRKPCNNGYYPIHEAAKNASSKTMEVFFQASKTRQNYVLFVYLLSYIIITSSLPCLKFHLLFAFACNGFQFAYHEWPALYVVYSICLFYYDFSDNVVFRLSYQAPNKSTASIRIFIYLPVYLFTS